MLSGFILPGGDATKQLELALVAEDAGWDGVFVWEGGYGVDAWTLLAAIAARTERAASARCSRRCPGGVPGRSRARSPRSISSRAAERS